MSSILDEIEALLTEPKPLEPIPPIAGQLTLEFTAEEAAAAGVGLTAIEFFPVVVLLGMMVGAAAWLRPSIEAQSHQHHSLLWKAVTWPVRRLAHAVKVIEARVMHAMSKWLAPKVGMVAHAFNSVTHNVHALTEAVADLSDNTHEAFVWLRHHVVPQLIHNAVQPLRKAVVRLAQAADSINDRLHTAAVEVADQLAAIGKTVGRTFTGAIGQLAVTVVELWLLVHETLVPQVKELQEVVIPALETAVQTLTTTVTETIPQELTAIRDRLKGIEDYIVSAAFIAIIVAAVEKALRFLTCRNMKALGNDACVFDEGWMDSLLALMFAGVILADLRTLTHIAQEIEGEVVSLVDDALSV